MHLDNIYIVIINYIFIFHNKKEKFMKKMTLLLLSFFTLSTSLWAAEKQSLGENHDKCKDKKGYTKVLVYNRTTHKIQKIKFNLKAHALKGSIPDLTIEFDPDFSPSQDKPKEIYLDNSGYIGGVKVAFKGAKDINYNDMYIEFARRSSLLKVVLIYFYDDYTDIVSSFERN